MEEKFHVEPAKAEAVTALMARLEKLEKVNRLLMESMKLRMGNNIVSTSMAALEDREKQRESTEGLIQEIREDNMNRWDNQIQQVITTANVLQKNLCESMEQISYNIKERKEKFCEKTSELPVVNITINELNVEDQTEDSGAIVVAPINPPKSGLHKAEALNKSIPKGEEMIMVVGGYNDDVRLDEMLILNGNWWATSSVKPPNGYDISGATFMSGELYIMDNSRKLHKLDIITMKWIRLTDMNERRSYTRNSFVNWNGCLWVFGGCDSDKKNVKASVERYDPKLEKWFDMPDMKHSRFFASATVHNGKFIVCGGVAENDVFLKSVECFDPESGVWTELNDLPTSVAAHAVVSYGNDAILMGGNCKYANKTKLTCEVLKLSALEKNEKWKEIQPIEYRRECFPAAVANDEIFIVGGINGADINKVEIFDGKKWRNGPPLSTGLRHGVLVVIPKSFANILCPNLETILLMGGIANHGTLDEVLLLHEGNWISLPLKLPKKSSAAGAVFLDGSVYILGGDSGKKLYKLNKNLKWIELADMHEERCYISCLAYNGEIWVFGSCNNNRTTITKGVERYNPKENKWTKMEDMHHARSDAAAAVWNGKFIVCGGWDGKGCVKSVECYDPETGIWTELNDMPWPRYGHRLVNYENNLILLGGNDGASCHKAVLELSNLEEKGEWKSLPSMESSHNCFVAEVIGQKIIAAGGTNGALLNKTEIFDGKTWKLGSPLPSARRHAFSVVIPFHLADILYADYTNNKSLQDLD